MKKYEPMTGQSRVRDERGSALIAALMIVSMLTMLGLSMLSTGLSGTRSVNVQSDDYRLQSAVESVGTLATEELWSAYLRQQGGAARRRRPRASIGWRTRVFRTRTRIRARSTRSAWMHCAFYAAMTAKGR